MEVIEPLYNYIYRFITTYILPPTSEFSAWSDVLVAVALVVTLGLFWACICRPVWWFFKYGMWGGSKKNKTFNRRDDD